MPVIPKEIREFLVEISPGVVCRADDRPFFAAGQAKELAHLPEGFLAQNLIDSVTHNLEETPLLARVVQQPHGLVAVGQIPNIDNGYLSVLQC